MGNRSNRRKKLGLVTKISGVLVTFMILAGASSCVSDTATTSAFCAILVGDGQSGRDANFHDLLYPQQQIDKDEGEVARYLPCNERTYITTNNAEEGGDRKTPTKTMTSHGVPVILTTSTSWRLSQSEAAMRAFYPFCEKFECYSTESSSGSANFSEPGWNGMLREYMSPTIDRIGAQAVYKIFDTEESLNDPEKWEAAEALMSQLFQEEIQSRTTTSEQMFCGGSSSWPNPDQPGVGEYQCDPVTIKIDLLFVDRDAKVSSSSESARTQNVQRFNSLEPLYGEYTNQAIMAIDVANACNQGATCIINIGGANGTTQVPVNNNPPPTPTPEVTEEPEGEG